MLRTQRRIEQTLGPYKKERRRNEQARKSGSSIHDLGAGRPCSERGIFVFVVPVLIVVPVKDKPGARGAGRGYHGLPDMYTFFLRMKLPVNMLHHRCVQYSSSYQLIEITASGIDRTRKIVPKICRFLRAVKGLKVWVMWILPRPGTAIGGAGRD